jgi:Zn-dependent protease
MDQKKKIYTSFHEIPVRDYMYFPKGTLEVGKPGKFSRVEILHILVSILVLTIAFSFWNRGLIFNMDLSIIMSSIPFAFSGVVTGFFFHEISHKFMAQKLGLWAEYRVYPMGLLLALMVSIFTGFVFAAPGAVMFMGGSRHHETGKIAMAGPLANIIVAFVTFLLFYYFLFENQIGSLLGYICLINALLATFNLLPLGPLDGIKIIKWNATVWVIMLILSITALMLVLTKTSWIV